jgi:hypothetical protein
MSTKLVNFLTTIWFVSVLICVIMEGTYFGVKEQGILDHLRLITQFHVGTLFSVPVFNVHFIQGLFDVLTWNYSFYSGDWMILRWFWTAMLTPGAVWGLGTAFAWVYGQLVSLFNLLPKLIPSV